jgi:hypothetical protein
VAFALLVLALSVAGCGSSKRLDAEVTRCCGVLTGPHETTPDASVTNRGENYRFTRADSTLEFSPVLDPVTSRRVSAPLQVNGSVGTAMHCIATHVTYGDGTTEE